MGQATNSSVRRFFTKAKTNAYDSLVWVKRDVVVKDPLTDQVTFEQQAVETPAGWSTGALSAVVRQYFAGTIGTEERETSLKQVIDRVVDTIARQGQQEGYFDTVSEAETFAEELKYILAAQRATFDGPVWRNVGVPGRSQQTSSAYILNVQDSLSDILQWYADESAILNSGAGSGVNVSAIRSSVEAFGVDGKAAGPLSFMRTAESSADAIRHGRNADAAKGVVMNVRHPDIEAFIGFKSVEADKVRALQQAGLDGYINNNGKTSVRVTDDFMQAVQNDDDWQLTAVTTGEPVRTVKARDLWRQIAEAAWKCANPGLQFDTSINSWYTTPAAGHINGSSPGGEYVHLDNSACNLASINLLQYLNDNLSFDVAALKHTVELLITAQEILVGYSEYPTPRIAKNAKAYRQLGVGYANLGAFLAAQGLSYGSDEARAQAAAITALLTGYGYATSAKLARKVGPFAGFHKDREGVLRVLQMHRQAVDRIDAGLVAEDVLSAATQAWDEAMELGGLHGVRNAQVSLLAAADIMGTTMDSETLNIPSRPGNAKADESAEDSSISPLGALRMMSALQPFLSGAIGQTVNLPENATVEDIEQLYFDAWRLGLKSITVYRTNCQAVTLAGPAEDERSGAMAVATAVPVVATVTEQVTVIRNAPVRRQLPKVRSSKTYKFHIGDEAGYLTVGEYEDGAPGELFVTVGKDGSALSGLLNAFAISISHGLQYGVPLKSYVKSFLGAVYLPSGNTDDSDIQAASSITDYMFHRLALDYLGPDDLLELGLANASDMPPAQTSLLDD